MERLITQFRRWFERERDIKYLSGLSALEVSGLDMSRAEALELAAAPLDTYERMRTMAHAHGLPDRVLGQDRWRNIEMAHTCARCSSRAECASWMHDEHHNLANARFCPNTAQYEELVETGEAPAGAS